MAANRTGGRAPEEGCGAASVSLRRRRPPRAGSKAPAGSMAIAAPEVDRVLMKVRRFTDSSGLLARRPAAGRPDRLSCAA
ncbi:hypothetical protein TBR22_A33180 [Luteitalea sp. TBR-22]|nr:hypothetical protein TBR22_A33180 [Luteitalea sp. TBR-22]